VLLGQQDILSNREGMSPLFKTRPQLRLSLNYVSSFFISVAVGFSWTVGKMKRNGAELTPALDSLTWRAGQAGDDVQGFQPVEQLLDLGVSAVPACGEELVGWGDGLGFEFL